MTNEEKQLLFKDLCARLPYGVKGKVETTDGNGKEIKDEGMLNSVFIDEHGATYICIEGIEYELEDVKLHLRPMSSMTEKEIDEYRHLSDEVVGSYGPYHYEFIVHCVRLGIKPTNPHECVDNFLNMGAIDWLNEHHFDYRRLIDKGLALEAPEGMYNFN